MSKSINLKLANYRLSAKPAQVLHAILYVAKYINRFSLVGLNDYLTPLTGLDQKKLSGALRTLREKNIIETDYKRGRREYWIKIKSPEEWR